MDNIIGYQLKAECLKAKPLTKEENLELVRRIQAGDKEAANQFVLRNGKLVIKVIKEKYPYYVDSEDIFQAGIMGLLKAADKFDFSFDNTVSTYAYNWIVQSIGRYIVDSESDIRIPIHTNEKLIKIKMAINKYENENIQKDKYEFIQAETGFDLQTIKELIPYIENSVSLNSIVNADDDSDTEMMDFIADSKDSIEKQVESKEIRNKIQEVLKEALNEREYTIIMYRFGFFGDTMTFDEIKRIVGITSRQGIQQCEARALRKLKHPRYASILRELYK